MKICFFILLIVYLRLATQAYSNTISNNFIKDNLLNSTSATAIAATQAEMRLQQSIVNPEYLLTHWINLPVSPKTSTSKVQHLTLTEAILLALRYNSNIQSAELERIIQRYHLRLAQNEFELQYALAGSAAAERSKFSGVGTSNSYSALAAPEINLRTKWGTQLSLDVENNVSNYNSYTPVLNFTIKQSLLRGFGKDVNEVNLLNAKDQEWLNQLSMQYIVSNQVTQVILAYRTLILSGNNLENQKMHLQEAQDVYKINIKKIAAGQLESSANVQQLYQIESLKLMVEQAENEFKTATYNLLQVIGLDPKINLSVPSDVQLNKLAIPDVQQAITTALQHNNEFLAQKMLLHADERAYIVAKNEQLWDLSITGNVQSGKVMDVGGAQGFRGIYNGQNITETAQITLTIPINDINRRSQLVQAKIKLEQDRLNIITAKRSLETNITNIITNIKSLAKQYQFAQKQVKLATQAYALEKKKLAAGIASALDVNSTQNQLIQAQAGLINAKIAYLNQLSTLQLIVGTTLDNWCIKLRYGK